MRAEVVAVVLVTVAFFVAVVREVVWLAEAIADREVVACLAVALGVRLVADARFVAGVARVVVAFEVVAVFVAADFVVGLDAALVVALEVAAFAGAVFAGAVFAGAVFAGAVLAGAAFAGADFATAVRAAGFVAAALVAVFAGAAFLVAAARGAAFVAALVALALVVAFEGAAAVTVFLALALAVARVGDDFFVALFVGDFVTDVAVAALRPAPVAAAVPAVRVDAVAPFAEAFPLADLVAEVTFFAAITPSVARAVNADKWGRQ